MAGATVAPNVAVAVNDDYYINKKLGVIFSKPNNWGYVALADYGKLKDQQILSNIHEDDLEDFWETIGGPTCMITKYHQDLSEHKGIFSPTIQFFVNHKSEVDDIQYDSFEEFIQKSRIGTSLFLKDFEVLHDKKPYEVDGCLFYEYDGQYTFEHQELTSPIQVRLNVVIVEHNNFYYYINMHDCPEQNQTAEEEFHFFKRSLKMI